jgi:hypothetical protein
MTHLEEGTYPVHRSPLFFAILLLAVFAAPAGAQDHTTAAGYGVGFLRPGDLNPGAGGAGLAMDAGWVITAFGEAWYAAGDQLGARVNGAFTNRPLQIGEDTREISTWMLDASLIARLLPPNEANVINPFLSVGGGLVSYGLGRGGELVFPEANVSYPGDDQVQWALVGGAGVDLTPRGLRLGATPLGIRLELADHVVLRSPFRGPDGERLGPIHNIRAGISLIGLGWF